jgi:hypothetical protein
MNKQVAVLITVLLFSLLEIPLLRGAIGNPVQTMICVNPPSNYGAIGETFAINVSIFDVADLYGYEFKLFYDTSILDCAKVEAPPDHFLKPNDPANIYWVKQEATDAFNATHGRVFVAVVLLGQEVPKTGDGTLVTITFLVTETGECVLDLYDTKLLDFEAISIPHNAIDGEFVTYKERPTANFNWTPLKPRKNETVAFDASNSLPSWNGTSYLPIIKYIWDFGDGTATIIGTNPTINHNFSMAGIYVVTLNVTDIKGLWGTISKSITVVIENKMDYWAIIIGIRDYKEIEDTWYTDKDAIELYDKLKGVWPEDHLKLLINEQASRSSIESVIKDWLAPKETAESVVLFFFSGHGAQGLDQPPFDEADGKDEYICPYDSLTDSYANDIRDDTLAIWLDLLDSQHASVFLTSCHGGGFTHDLSKGGRVVITACTETEESYESTTLKHTVFTHYMLKGLSNLTLLDDNKDNAVSAEEVFDYVEPLVIGYMAERGYAQHPQMYDGYDGELTLITTAKVNFDTAPCKASIIIGAVSYTPPVSFVWTIYTEHTFQVSQQVWSAYGGTRYLFTSWSDGSNLTSRTIIVSESVLTNYTANYETQHYLTISSGYGTPQGEGWYESGSVVAFSVSSPVDYGNGTRLVFTGWSGDSSSTNLTSTTVMNGPKHVVAQWKTQHYFNVDGDPSGVVSMSGEGWYDEDSVASTGSAPPMVSGGEGIQYLFETWKVDNVTEDGNSISVIMDSPHSSIACYKTQHYLTIVSQYGQPEGEGWYDEDSVATFSVESPQGFLIQKVFAGWSGDLTSTSTSATVVMNGQKTVTASWRDEYTQLFIILAVTAVVVIILVAVIWKLRARKP